MRPSKLAASRPAAVVDDPARAAVETALAELGETAEEVSRAIAMPPTYLRGYLESGEPATLPNRIRRRLAAYLGIPEFAL